MTQGQGSSTGGSQALPVPKSPARHRAKRERGGALIEFGIGGPILLTIILIIFDFTRYLSTYMEANRFAYEGARYASTIPSLVDDTARAAALARVQDVIIAGEPDGTGYSVNIYHCLEPRPLCVPGTSPCDAQPQNQIIPAPEQCEAGDNFIHAAVAIRFQSLLQWEMFGDQFSRVVSTVNSGYLAPEPPDPNP